jgi:hypothetical protein
MHIHSFIHGQLSCFNIWPIVNKTVMNMGVQIHLWGSDVNCCRYIHRSGMARSYNSSILMFWEILHYFSHKLHNFTIPPRVHRAPASPHSHQHLYFPLVLAILTALRWYLIMVFTYISLMIIDLYIYIFIYLLVICIVVFLEKFPLNSAAQF